MKQKRDCLLITTLRSLSFPCPYRVHITECIWIHTFGTLPKFFTSFGTSDTLSLCNLKTCLFAKETVNLWCCCLHLTNTPEEKSCTNLLYNPLYHRLKKPTTFNPIFSLVRRGVFREDTENAFIYICKYVGCVI